MDLRRPLRSREEQGREDKKGTNRRKEKGQFSRKRVQQLKKT